MADDIILFKARQTYVPIGTGATGITLRNEHIYRPLRIALADMPPTNDHLQYHIVIGREGVSHFDIPEGFVMYVRADTSSGEVHGHYRQFDS